MGKWKFMAMSFLCAIAMFIATNSAGVMCMGRYYQPEEPKELGKIKK